MKKYLTLVLALAMCLGLAAPAAAEELPMSVEEGIRPISIRYDIADTGALETTLVNSTGH